MIDIGSTSFCFFFFFDDELDFVTLVGGCRADGFFKPDADEFGVGEDATADGAAVAALVGVA